MRIFVALSLALFSLASFAQQPPPPLTFEAVFDPKKGEELTSVVKRSITWMDDRRFIWPRIDASGKVDAWMIHDAASGKETMLFETAPLSAALTKSAGLSEGAAGKMARSSAPTFDAAHGGILFEAADDLFLWSIANRKLTRLTSTPEAEKVPSFSPDGRKVAFVRENDLYVFDLDSRTERRLTTTGSENRLNGILDWVYQEEVYGRGNWTGYWWSPDSARIAFLSLDETRVPRYTLVDDIPYQPEVEVVPYPRAGDPNPVASLHVVPAAGGAVKEMDLASYGPPDFLVVNVAWTPEGTLTAQVQNRTQTWLDLVAFDAGSGSASRLLRETTPAWTDMLGEPHWLNDGSFLWMSERSGWQHIDHYDAKGTLVRQLTKGEWDVEDLAAVDQKRGVVYFSATERSAIGSDVYSIALDGTGMKRLSEREGTHRASFSPDASWFVDTWSDVVTPTRVSLHRAGGERVRQLWDSAMPALGGVRLDRPEFLKVPARDGFPLEAMILRPPGFDPSKKYPVYQFLYAGPEAPSVRNGWGASSALFRQLVANEGYIVWVLDNRTASARGSASSWPIHRNLGESELRDIEDGIAWLATQPWADTSRVAIHGWSYGGFMVSYAMTHSRSFAAGIAGGSVTDWRDYDSIYTERVMGLPQENPEGYRKSSPRFAAKELHGRLLLIHGTIDDNVHPQNTIQFIQALQEAGKQFELMLYPKARHGIVDDAQRRHMHRMILDFLERTVGGD